MYAKCIDFACIYEYIIPYCHNIFSTKTLVPSQENEWSFIYVLYVLTLPLFTIFLLEFGTVLTVRYIFAIQIIDNIDQRYIT